MAVATWLCNLPSKLLTLLRRRLRIARFSLLQVVVVAVIVLIIIWSRHRSMSTNKFIMGQQGKVFENIIDDVTHSIDLKGQFEIRNHDKVALATQLGVGFSTKSGAISECESQKANEECLQFDTVGKTTIYEYVNRNVKCFDVYSVSLDEVHSPMDCFRIENEIQTFWYGGAQTYHDQWPINLNIKPRPHVSDTGGYGSVLERYWFSSRGVGIFVDDLVPLHIKANGKTMCLIGKYDGEVYISLKNKLPFLKYTICTSGNVLDIHEYMSQRYIKRPNGIPDEKMIKYPVWSTWAKFKSSVTQEKTKEFTDEIVNHGFLACQIEIDDRYTVNYGDYIFDTNKFPDPKQLIDYIHSKGFRVTVWTHPFSNFDTESYTEGKEHGYWVMDETGSEAGLARWWRGQGGVLDVTNPVAVRWFFMRLKQIRNLGVDGHKYDAGEIGFLPKRFKTKKQLQTPSQYSTIYAETMYNNTNNFMQVRVGYKSQHLPIFVSMMDRNSDWGYLMGLRSLITTSLVFSSIGYFFIMPDMIGGNAYCGGNMDCNDVKPDRELYIRWIQLNAFLPMMQFSITPWQYDNKVVEIAKKYVTLHSDYVAPKIISLGKEAKHNGHPIIRPMWWVSPDDPFTYNLDSQFMVGNDLLVAPVLEQGTTERQVYLPQGIWKNMNTGVEITVETDGYLTKSGTSDIADIPYYERVLIP